MTLMRPRIFPEAPTLREAIDRLFDESFIRPGQWFATDLFERPAIDAYMTPEAFVVKVAVPGLKAEDIHTTLAGNVLTVEGTRREGLRLPGAEPRRAATQHQPSGRASHRRHGGLMRRGDPDAHDPQARRDQATRDQGQGSRLTADGGRTAPRAGRHPALGPQVPEPVPATSSGNFGPSWA
jgi:hypothetical protein